MELSVNNLSDQIGVSKLAIANSSAGSAMSDLQNTGAMSGNSEEDFASLKDQMIKSTKNIYKQSQELNTNYELENVGTIAMDMTSNFAALVDNVKKAAASQANDESTKETIGWVQKLGASIMAVADSVKDSTTKPDPETVRSVGENCVKVLTSLTAASKKAQGASYKY